MQNFDYLKTIQQVESFVVDSKSSDILQTSKLFNCQDEKSNSSFQFQKKNSLNQFKVSRTLLRKRLSLDIPNYKSIIFSKIDRSQAETETSLSKSCSFQQTQIKFINQIKDQNFLSNVIDYFKVSDECPINLQKQDFYEKYQKIVKLGQGAHSLVYKCKNIKTNEFFAVKVCQNIDQEMKTLLIKQYKLIKVLNHDNILKVQQLFYNQKEQKLYVVCELCGYQNLRQEITKRTLQNQTFSEKETLQLIRKILETIQYLQNSGVCHRDIKPQNILYDRETKKIKLIDFDIFKQKFKKNQDFLMWTNTGSLHYRAPETFSLGYEQKIDIWSLGVIFYELLTGEVPFNSNYERQTIKKIKEAKLDKSKVKSSSKTKVLLAKMLQKQVKLRFSSKQCLSFFKSQKHYAKDDMILEQHYKQDNIKTLQFQDKQYFQDESCRNNLHLSYRIKMDYLDWKITILS